MLFDESITTSEQGDIGEARAIYEFVKLGYVVSKPINDKAKYDLIIDTGDCLKRVQVKTSRHRKPGSSDGCYALSISTKYSNRNNTN